MATDITSLPPSTLAFTDELEIQKPGGQSQKCTVQQISNLSGGVTSGTLLTVSPDGSGTHSNIQAAIDAITDSSASKPYTVIVSPGTYAPFALGGKTNITVRGVGKGSIIATSSTGARIDATSTSCVIDNFWIKHDDDGSPASIRSAVYRTGPTTGLILRNLRIDMGCAATATAQRFAIDIEFTGLTDRGVLFESVEIFTECSGVRMPGGQSEMHNCKINLLGSTAHTLDQYGIYFAHTGGSRLWVFSSIIKTGYPFAEISRPAGTYGVFIAGTATNTGQRIELFNCWGIIRNESATATEVYAIKAENGWIRAFACKFQSEPAGIAQDWDAYYGYFGTVSQPPTGTGGKIELWACRGGTAAGAGAASATNGAARAVVTETTQLSKYEGDKVYCDSGGAGVFTLTLPVGDSSTGEAIRVVNLNNTDAVTVGAGTGGTITDLVGGASAQTYSLAPETAVLLYMRSALNWTIVDKYGA